MGCNNNMPRDCINLHRNRFENKYNINNLTRELNNNNKNNHRLKIIRRII
jgi:hypothetical protein